MKIATMEEIGERHYVTALAVQPEEKEVSPMKRQALVKMVEECTCDLTVEIKEQLFQLLLKYADIFADKSKLGSNDRIVHTINTGNAELTRQPVRRLPVCQRKELKGMLTEMEEKEVI